MFQVPVHGRQARLIQARGQWLGRLQRKVCPLTGVGQHCVRRQLVEVGRLCSLATHRFGAQRLVAGLLERHRLESRRLPGGIGIQEIARNHGVELDPPQPYVVCAEPTACPA